MFDFKIGFLAKFCVIGGISEFIYTYKYMYILVTVGPQCPLVITPGVITSGHIDISKSHIYPIPTLGIDW